MVFRLELPAQAGAHEALHSDAEIHETAEGLAAEVDADRGDLARPGEVFPERVFVIEGQSGADAELGIQAHVRPVEPGELHHGHRAHEAEVELPVGGLVPVAVHRIGVRGHVVAQDHPAEAEPVIDIMDILYAGGAVHMGIVESEVPEGERRAQRASENVDELRDGDLPVGEGEFILVLVVLGVTREYHGHRQERCH